MMEHLGGPESPRAIERRHRRYAKPGSRQFRIVDEAAGEAAGWVGYWEREWRGEDVYETGWSVLPEFQGRGIAGAATLEVIAKARSEGGRRYLHAFPSVDNAPSNAICRKAGFTLLGVFDFEYPPGNALRCNDWFVDLRADYD
jgi:RimJ/RimL family protein N-acetyltransferase